MLVVALGPRHEVASLEATAIASGGCRGNTAGARGAGLIMPRRRRAQAGRARSKQRGPRRAFLTRLEPQSIGCPWRIAGDAGLRIASRAGRRASSWTACATLSFVPNSTPRGSARGGALA